MIPHLSHLHSHGGGGPRADLPVRSGNGPNLFQEWVPLDRDVLEDMGDLVGLLEEVLE